MPPSGAKARFDGKPDVTEAMTIGRYRVVRHLATGGMADVFLARADGLQGFQKLVVIKRLLPTLEGTASFANMFLDEARLAASLQHANIVQVFDVGIADGRHFMAMEYLHGRDLGSLMGAVRDEKGVPLELACYIIASASAGLHHAHERLGPDGAPLNIVHRDLSPRNVFIGFDGHVKVVDFGIAKAEGRLTKTRTGALKGTPGYMSPEQAFSRPLDRRSDVFSLSILLWELAANRRLFRRSDDYQSLRALLEETPPPPSQFSARCPPDLDAIVARGLARDVSERFASAEELQLAIERLAQEHGLALAPRGLARLMRDLFPEDADLSRLQFDDGGSGPWRQGEGGAPTSSSARPSPASSEDSPAQDSRAKPPGPPSSAEAAPPAARRRLGLAAAAVALVGTAGALGFALRGQRSELGETPGSVDLPSAAKSGSSPAAPAAPAMAAPPMAVPDAISLAAAPQAAAPDAGSDAVAGLRQRPGGHDRKSTGARTKSPVSRRPANAPVETHLDHDSPVLP
jgi:serine/threonine protein kinase